MTALQYAGLGEVAVAVYRHRLGRAALPVPTPQATSYDMCNDIRERAQELLMEFADEYVRALLLYCMDGKRPGTHLPGTRHPCY